MGGRLSFVLFQPHWGSSHVSFRSSSTEVWNCTWSGQSTRFVRMPAVQLIDSIAFPIKRRGLMQKSIKCTSGTYHPTVFAVFGFTFCGPSTGSCEFLHLRPWGSKRVVTLEQCCLEQNCQIVIQGTTEVYHVYNTYIYIYVYMYKYIYIINSCIYIYVYTINNWHQVKTRIERWIHSMSLNEHWHSEIPLQTCLNHKTKGAMNFKVYILSKCWDAGSYRQDSHLQASASTGQQYMNPAQWPRHLGRFQNGEGGSREQVQKSKADVKPMKT